MKHLQYSSISRNADVQLQLACFRDITKNMDTDDSGINMTRSEQIRLMSRQKSPNPQIDNEKTQFYKSRRFERKSLSETVSEENQHPPQKQFFKKSGYFEQGSLSQRIMKERMSPDKENLAQNIQSEETSSENIPRPARTFEAGSLTEKFLKGRTAGESTVDSKTDEFSESLEQSKPRGPEEGSISAMLMNKPKLRRQKQSSSSFKDEPR